MSSYSHAPEDYQCPFCHIVSGIYSRDGVIYSDERVTALLSLHGLPNNPGHVLVIPNRHIENIYDLTPDIAVYVYELARQVALAFKEIYGCDGTSTRQHNEPAGNQDVWHFHLHVFPRYYDDQLYERTREWRLIAPDERRTYAEKLKRYFDGKRITVEM